MDLTTAAFIEARALALGYEATNHPATSAIVRNWLNLARERAFTARRYATAEAVDAALRRLDLPQTKEKTKHPVKPRRTKAVTLK